MRPLYATWLWDLNAEHNSVINVSVDHFIYVNCVYMIVYVVSSDRCCVCAVCRVIN